ncbi:MAG: nucleotide exchange factor GrpE [Gemmatimonadaceae bacterium]
MRKRHHQSAASADVEPPVPEAQGDGEPSPADVRERADAEGRSTADSAVDTPAMEGGPAPADARTDATAELTRQIEEQRDKYLRLAAEYDNYRRRTTKERLEASSRGQADLVSRMLEVIDDLARFADVDPATTDAPTLHKGIELVEQKLMKALIAAGLEIIDPVDQSFDPNLHEAITTEPAIAEEDHNTVGKVFQRGYRFGGQLLRPARVVVKQWTS